MRGTNGVVERSNTGPVNTCAGRTHFVEENEPAGHASVTLGVNDVGAELSAIAIGAYRCRTHTRFRLGSSASRS